MDTDSGTDRDTDSNIDKGINKDTDMGTGIVSLMYDNKDKGKLANWQIGLKARALRFFACAL